MAALVLLDAGPLVALMDHRERYHDWTKDAFARLQLPLMTCQAVLTEAFFLLRGQPSPLAKLYRHVEAGRFVDPLEFNALAPRIMELMERYANVPMSFADACLVALADESPVAKVFTLDRDFLIYRHSNGRPLELLAPFVEGPVGW